MTKRQQQLYAPKRRYYYAELQDILSKMSNFQQKIIRHAEKQKNVTHTQEKRSQ